MGDANDVRGAGATARRSLRALVGRGAWALGGAFVGALLMWSWGFVAVGWRRWGIVTIVALAGAFAVAAWRRRRSSSLVVASPRVVLRGDTLWFDAGDRGTGLRAVATLSRCFGVTLLANRARSRVVLVVTAEDATFYVGASVDEAARSGRSRLLASASTVASDERALDAAGPDGASVVVPFVDLERLHDDLVRRDPQCRERLQLTDVRGEQISLDAEWLQAGRHLFDLRSPLSWRGVIFRESSPVGLTVYQGTHVRQGGAEALFVSLMPALASPSSPGDAEETGEPEIERAISRDLELLRESLVEPPPDAPRIAIDRVFMLPLRRALASSRPRSPTPSRSMLA